MQTVVSQRLNEGNSGPVFYPAAEITAALNEGLRFFVLLTLGLEQTTSWTVPADTTFFHMLQVTSGGNPVFPDWIVCLRISDATGAKVRPARYDDLFALNPQWRNSPGSPVRYCVRGADYLGLYQQPAAPAVLNVTYARGPVPLVSGGDVPEIPAEYHPSALVNYGIYRMRQGEGAQEFQKALPMFDEFLKAAKHYAAYVRARNIGSRYDAVPFEIESFDTSQLLKLRKDLVPTARPPET